MVCWKFLSLYSSAKIFEIDKDLTKLSPKFGTTVFFGTQCSYNGLLIGTYTHTLLEGVISNDLE